MCRQTELPVNSGRQDLREGSSKHMSIHVFGRSLFFCGLNMSDEFKEIRESLIEKCKEHLRKVMSSKPGDYWFKDKAKIARFFCAHKSATDNPNGSKSDDKTATCENENVQ